MKHLFSFLLLFCMTAVNAQIILKGDMNDDGKIDIADVTLLVDVTLDKTPVDTVSWKQFEHEFVDLGLPSGTLWATSNIGACCPEEYGYYFAWGETEGYKNGKTEFSWNTYKWCNGSSSSLIKYNTSSNWGIVDNKEELDLEDDAAYVNWGPVWCIPSREQFEELINSSYTTTEWTTQKGVNGYKITSKKNGNFIFLPASGCRYDSSIGLVGVHGLYWLPILDEVNSAACYFDFDLKGLTTYGSVARYYGLPVRPVRFSQNPSIQVSNLSMSESSLTMDTGTTAQLSVTITPSNASDKTVLWVSSNENVARVDANGLVTAVAKGTCFIISLAIDGSGKIAMCEVTVNDAYVYHEFVDLGLPSGTLWATCNIGANSPEEYGDYFAWGETEGYNSGKTNFDWINYKWCEGSSITLTKYNTENNKGTVDDKTKLDEEDDAAYVNWGEDWRIPTNNQFNELINVNYTTTKWTTQNGVNGYIITSNSNNNSIFLPAAGYYEGSLLSLTESKGYYWSCELFMLTKPGTDYACRLNMDSRSIGLDYGSRNCGRSVRPVRASE